jgi:hypothetical protein
VASLPHPSQLAVVDAVDNDRGYIGLLVSDLNFARPSRFHTRRLGSPQLYPSAVGAVKTRQSIERRMAESSKGSLRERRDIRPSVVGFNTGLSRAS